MTVQEMFDKYADKYLEAQESLKKLHQRIYEAGVTTQLDEINIASAQATSNAFFTLLIDLKQVNPDLDDSKLR